MAIICDRCGERIDSYRTHMFVSTETNVNHIDPKSDYEDFDLCKDCNLLFKAFMRPPELSFDHDYIVDRLSALPRENLISAKELREILYPAKHVRAVNERGEP